MEKGLHIDLSAAVTIEEVGRALGLWSDEEQEQQQLQQQQEEEEQQQLQQEEGEEEQQQQQQQHHQQQQLGQELGVEPAESEAITDGQQYVGEHAEEATNEIRDDKTGAGAAAN